MAEHLTLPPAHPGLRDVECYLGWTGAASRPLQAASLVGGWATRLSGMRAALERLAARAATAGAWSGPDEARRSRSGSHVMAVARDSRGAPLAEIRLQGIDGYELTGNLLAWAAVEAAQGRLAGTGALGPVEAFGLEALEAGCAEAGIARLG